MGDRFRFVGTLLVFCGAVSYGLWAWFGVDPWWSVAWIAACALGCIVSFALPGTSAGRLVLQASGPLAGPAGVANEVRVLLRSGSDEQIRIHKRDREAARHAWVRFQAGNWSWCLLPLAFTIDGAVHGNFAGSGHLIMWELLIGSGLNVLGCVLLSWRSRQLDKSLRHAAV